MTKYCLFLCISFFPCLAVWGQKTYTATRLEQAPQLDGRADDACWQQIAPIDIALTSTPVFGQPALPATVRLFYTADALYVFATFSGAAVRGDGSQRDDPGLGDWFSIGLDTWNDDQNAFVFTVTAGGVQTEQRVGGNGVETNWDVVWQSAVAQQADGWSVEIRLPFTSLRFPRRDEQRWGLQCSRFDRSSGTLSTWNPRQPQIGDEVLQYGTLAGLHRIEQRQRLSAAVHSRIDRVTSKRYTARDKFNQLTLGIDGRWGFASNSTLDLALLPSASIFWDRATFSGGQPLDLVNGIGLPEPRQLLAEERPMFNKGGIFLEYPVLLPQNVRPRPGEFATQINISPVLTAAKFSTRLPGNIGLGVYSTLLGPTSAEFVNLSAPGGIYLRTQQLSGLSNYTLLTMEKALARNSWISLSNAHILGFKPERNNLSALDFQLREASNRYQVAGNIQVNIPIVNDTAYRPSNQYAFSVGKVNSTWTWQLSHLKNNHLSADILNSDPYAALPAEDHYSVAEIGYRDFRGHGWWQNTSGYLRLTKDWEQAVGNFDHHAAELGVTVLTQKFQQWMFRLSSNLQNEYRAYHFEQNLLYRQLSPYIQTSLSFRSDGRKRFYYQINTEVGGNVGGERATWDNTVALTWAITPRLRLQTENNVFFSLLETRELINLPTPGYYLTQFNALRFRHSWRLSWFYTPYLNLYGHVEYYTANYKRERALQVTAEGHLAPFNYAFVPSPHQFDRQLELGYQLFFGPISQLRIRCSYFPDRFTFASQNLFFTFPQKNARTTQLSLSFIYFLDGNKKR